MKAVDGVSFAIETGETVGLVGKSGCGKSTLGKSLLRLVPASGRIVYDGTDLAPLGERQLRPFRRRLQMVFQDPFGSLNPRHTVGAILDAPLRVHRLGDRTERAARIVRMLDRIGLPQGAAHRHPHEFSGGQRQRIGIARALILEPELVVCDEPVSALDLSIQAQVLNLLVEMKKDMGLSYLFISHDLSVVRYFADRVLVMYLGRIIESGPAGALWDQPLHPYTQVLLDAVPDPSRKRQAAPLAGDRPSAADLPPGCRFHTRCLRATAECAVVEPELRPRKGGRHVACHHAAA